MNERLLKKLAAAKAKKPTTKNILALDPAEKFGWAISNTVYGMWDFKLKRDESFGMKLIRFRSKLEEIVKSENISIIAFERPSGNRPAAIMSHAKFVAIIETFCFDNNLEFRGYSATEIKKFATGKGNSNKAAMLEAARVKLNYTGNDDNEADALWLLNLIKEDLNL